MPVQEVLVVAGKDEVFADDVVAFTDKLKSAVKDITLLVAEGECHDQAYLDIEFGYKEPGAQAKMIRSWIESKL